MARSTNPLDDFESPCVPSKITSEAPASCSTPRTPQHTESEDNFASRPSWERRKSLTQSKSFADPARLAALVHEQNSQYQSETTATFNEVVLIRRLQIGRYSVPWPMFIPDTTFRICWEFSEVVFIFFELITIPYRVAFKSPARGIWEVFEHMSVAFFLVDVFLNFCTGHYYRGELVLSPKKTILMYARTWFPVDFVASFPYSWIIMTVSSESNVDSLFFRTLLGFRLLRIMHVTQLVGKLRRLEQSATNLYYGAIAIAIGRTLVCLVLLTHFAACMWYKVGVWGIPRHCQDEPWMCVADSSEYRAWFLQIDWTDEAWQGSDPKLLLYCHSVYFCLATFTTVGFGDITPISKFEKLYVILMFLVSIFAFSAIVGAVAELVKDMNRSRTVYRQKFADLARYISWRRLPWDLQIRVRRYVQYRWEYETDLKDKEATLLGYMSPSLRQEICAYVYGEDLRMVPFLSWLTGNSSSFDWLASQCHSSYLAPGELLFHAGQMDASIYVINSGNLAIVKPVNFSDLTERNSHGAHYDHEPITPGSASLAQMQDMIHGLAGVGQATMEIIYSKVQMGAVPLLESTVNLAEAPVFYGRKICMKLGNLRKSSNFRTLQRAKSCVLPQGGSSANGSIGSISQQNEAIWNEMASPHTISAVCTSHCSRLSLQASDLVSVMVSFPFLWVEFKRWYDSEMAKEPDGLGSKTSTMQSFSVPESSSSSSSNSSSRSSSPENELPSMESINGPRKVSNGSVANSGPGNAKKVTLVHQQNPEGEASSGPDNSKKVTLVHQQNPEGKVSSTASFATKSEISELTQTVKMLVQSMNDVKTEVLGVRSDVSELRDDVAKLKTTAKEETHPLGHSIEGPPVAFHPGYYPVTLPEHALHWPGMPQALPENQEIQSQGRVHTAPDQLPAFGPSRSEGSNPYRSRSSSQPSIEGGNPPGLQMHVHHLVHPFVVPPPGGSARPAYERQANSRSASKNSQVTMNGNDVHAFTESQAGSPRPSSERPVNSWSTSKNSQVLC